MGSGCGYRSFATAVLAALVAVAGAVTAPGTPAAAHDRPPPAELAEPADLAEQRAELAQLYRTTGYAMTPDQGWAPEIPEDLARMPERLQPEPEPLRVLPDLEHAPPGQRNKQAPFCTGKSGPYQRQLERFLKLRPVDGRQSARDCRAVQDFQQEHYIDPAIGYAGPVTWGEAKLERARKHLNPGGRCPVVRRARVVCVDLSQQLLWVQRGRKRVFGPAPVRTGKPGYETRGGWHRIYWRHKDHWSTLYDAPMPYSQFFDGGQALHGVYGSLFRGPGSAGCVNMRYAEAQALWKTLRKGDRVYVFGHKPPPT